MGKTLYLECRAGISGDMFVASLLDLGADENVLRQGLASLSVDGFQIEVTRVKKSGLDACDFNVILDGAHENHDHDMDYLHGGAHEHQHGHWEHGHHEHEHEHCHGEEHPHEHEHEYCHGEEQHHGHEHHHEHRGLKEIYQIIDQAEITDRAKAYSRAIFRVLAEAESKAHGVPIEEVHFHEVGAVDSIVDVIAAGICMDNLDIAEVIAPELWEGTGTVRCQHGILPIPVPAVANIVAEHHIRIHITDVEGELVTPTGAAIVAAFRTKTALPDGFEIEKIGIGAGKRQYATAGIVRAMLIN